MKVAANVDSVTYSNIQKRKRIKYSHFNGKITATCKYDPFQMAKLCEKTKMNMSQLMAMCEIIV